MKTELITALDFPDIEGAMALVDRIGEDGVWYKVGKQLFTACGPEVVRQLKSRGKKVFLDLKYHDIPNTVAQAVASAARIGADMCNVHASGGPAMLSAAAEAADKARILLTAVTVLTSMDAGELAAIGINQSPLEQVLRLAKLAQANGVAGVVCSSLELDGIKKTCGSNFIAVVPGIRPADTAADDQKRIMTPRQAAERNADFIVVGRPITKAADPAQAVKMILNELH